MLQGKLVTDQALQAKFPSKIKPKVTKCTGMCLSWKWDFVSSCSGSEPAGSSGGTTLGGLQQGVSWADGALCKPKAETGPRSVLPHFRERATKIRNIFPPSKPPYLLLHPYETKCLWLYTHYKVGLKGSIYTGYCFPCKKNLSRCLVNVQYL